MTYNNLPIHYIDGQNTSEVKIVNIISDEKGITLSGKKFPFLFGFLHSRGILLLFLPLFLPRLKNSRFQK